MVGVTANQDSERYRELKAFDDTKLGVKGIVDSGITKIPPLFYHPPDHKHGKASNTEHIIPVIDLADVDKDPTTRKDIVESIRVASETWGFFQIVNHGIPLTVLDEIKEGVRRFFEQDDEPKKAIYRRDWSVPFVYNSNFDLFSSPAPNWRDTFCCFLAPKAPKPEDIPEICR